MMGSSNMVSQWFNRKRGTALGLMTLGFGISMAVHPELSQWLIEWVGWREAWFWIGVTTWILVLPPIVILAISKPEDVGLHPDGVNRSSTDEDGAESVGPQMDFTLSEALHAPAFYIVAASLFTLSMLVTSLHFYQVSIFADQGLKGQISLPNASPSLPLLHDRDDACRRSHARSGPYRANGRGRPHCSDGIVVARLGHLRDYGRQSSLRSFSAFRMRSA